MSKPNLYETNWIDLVFENRNKEYGAYQLRKESTRTSVFALFIGILLCASLMSVPRVLSYFNVGKEISVTIPKLDQIIHITNIVPNIIKKKQNPIPPKASQQKAIAIIDKKQLTNPTIVKADLATPDIAKNIENNAVANKNNEGMATIGMSSTNSQGSGTETSKDMDSGNDVVTSNALDKQPEFPGGISKFYAYISRKFESPEIDEAKNIRIFVYFVVEKDGSMSDIQVKNNPGYGLEKEAIRVLKSLKTKWTPGIIDSKPVRTAYSLPITIQMN
ncbi:energy transducer TonB [Flavobacterium granuli]|uniref:Outer membrane transport energization protein TonB n=1 Tax=Flavobacterium granuli TaxID=280093 RepID=A0A1M5J9C0_9FLAO|nr:energy transducer TonB [Flavobacterium granuli]PRZ28289.1 outer membrane transport energization protein TonB [Flavobacterium granuli]SHG37196.1 outer membrane transport energization protein TonB [Flavobacterium granuli]